MQSCREKISKWQSQVSKRLKSLARRADQVNKVGSPKTSQESGANYDAKLVEMINATIVDRSPSVKWEDVAGLEKAKQTLMEMIILPTKRRDLFTGLRRPARGEKLVRTLFKAAVSRQPSVIFVDEIDSIMSTRFANEHETSRRLKSEFLIHFDGVTSNPDDIVIVIGATNKPQELDDAFLGRVVKRIYVPSQHENARKLLLKQKLKDQAFSLPSGDLERLVKETEGYSGSDLQALCEEAAMMPIRELGADILTVEASHACYLKLLCL
ncbi:Spastin protein [Spatholobus suberectus]|nr:Spastin protein [Spatholobus suberectus]